MALITCSECGKQISDRAGVCPHCGSPVASAQQAQPVYAAFPARNTDIIYGKSTMTAGRWICRILAILCWALASVNIFVSIILLISGTGGAGLIQGFIQIPIGFLFFSISRGYRITVTRELVSGSFPFGAKMKVSPAEIAEVSVYGANEFLIRARGKEYKFKNIPNRDQVVKFINELIAPK